MEKNPKFLSIFFESFLVSGKSQSAQKCEREGALGLFEHPICCETKKMKKGPFGDNKKLAKKVSQSQNNLHKKIWSRKGFEPTSFCLADLKKSLTSMPSTSRSSVAQFSVSASQLIKLRKSVSSRVLKKEKSLLKSAFFTKSAD